MDTKLNSSFAAGERVFGHEIEPILREYGLSHKAPDRKKTFLGGPATEYASPSHRGRIGLINPLSCNFCSDCNRLRVTARGGLKLCLFGNDDIPLDLSSPASVARDVRRVIGQKPEKHYLEDGLVGNVATFRTIGG
jgi:cyclic pyranopterin phosphate synthase